MVKITFLGQFFCLAIFGFYRIHVNVLQFIKKHYSNKHVPQM